MTASRSPGPAREFHDLLVAFAPNATVRHVIGSLVALWSAQEQTWAETMTQRGEYPSPREAARAVATHRRIAEEIAAGHAAGPSAWPARTWPRPSRWCWSASRTAS